MSPAVLLLAVTLSEGRPSFAESLSIHAGLRGANVLTTRWSIDRGATEANPLMRTHLEAKQAGVAVALALTETRLSRKHRRLLRAMHLAGTAVYMWKDVRAGRKAMEAR